MSHPYPPTRPVSSPSAQQTGTPPGPDQTTPRTRPVVPVGTLAVVAFLFLNIVFMWMLALGVQQGRA
ncbi:hypothetical protein Deipr_0206 [Deinococcus proteolyticus MRP]|uniref:Uncharacterized protein n=1 Tax=Deinococcus proteolyticus (strain ATCC 35074 / DSM 20540 / JCM 6276 / NBRC 101906 / NCIMB 13154 / VKM Ac-1939 / CCM 2703 / MRP) TaxID=693977 RepID=F0RP64_DEIPM|nr:MULTISPECIES: hypothetical protein [Deinococcus]ADY25379.1 hypothetical protein Deipr_0206 [Deinococcus proteolyticus MRP]MCY1701504.1 hypothetical protein [Deinococcus sp. SL84]